MKKLYATVIITLTTLTAFSQNTNPWPSTGSVGIGTASPGAPLEVVVSDANASSVSTALIVNKKTSGTADVGIGSAIDFYAQAPSGNSFAIANITGLRTGAGAGTNSNGALLFKTARSSTSGLIENMRINRIGFVGIGETNPQYALDISNLNNTTVSPTIRIKEPGATGISQLRLENDLGIVSNFFVHGSTASGTNYFGQARPNLTVLKGGEILTIGTMNANPLILGTSNAERMRIASDGKVGIGTTSPSEKLHVTNGGIKISNTGSIGLKLFNVGDDTEKMHLYWRSDDVIVLNTGASPGRDLSFITGVAESIRIKASGNVGIGTSTPDAKLAVKGTIHSQKVLVDLNGWSDYVFKPEYKLPSLSEVKTYINKNQHLPDIPSEKELAESGVDVTEMLKLQMKKIEELTLYLIEKDEKLKQQEDRLKQLEDALLKKDNNK